MYSSHKSIITENAEKVLKSRYYLKNEQGVPVENWDSMCKRIAKAISSVETEKKKQEKYYTKFYDIIHNLDFLPNTPTLVNAGKHTGLSACYVVPLKNDYIQLLKSLQDVAKIFKSGGGVGFNFSWIELPAFFDKEKTFYVYLDKNHSDYDEFKNIEFKYLKKTDDQYITNNDTGKNQLFDNTLIISDNIPELFNFSYLLNDYKNIQCINFSNVRHKDSIVKSTGGTASGPISFMKAWDSVIEFLSNPITPITAIKLFNSCTEAVKQGGVRRGACMGILNADSKYIYDFISCKDNEKEINNFNLSVGIVDDSIFNNEEFYLKDYAHGYVNTWKCCKSKDFLDLISTHAWKTGEPGIIFLNKINKHNPIRGNVIVSTNPCKQKLHQYIEIYIAKSMNCWEILRA